MASVLIKVETPEELREQLPRVLEESELAIAQAYTPSPFDWRIGILEKSDRVGGQFGAVEDGANAINEGLKSIFGK